MRGSLVTICMAAALCLAQHVNGASHTQGASSETSPSSSNPASHSPAGAVSAVGQISERVAATREGEIGCSKPADKYSKECQDLQAQKEMARWAFWMWVATAASVGVGLITFGLVYQTFKVTRASSEKQLRAYVGIKKAYAVWSADEDDAMRWVSVIVDIQNTGQTPASKMTNWVASKSSKEPPVEFSTPSDKGADSVGLLWPGQINHMRFERHLVLGVEHEISLWRKGAEALYVWGEIKYLDGFSKEVRTTSFRYVMPKEGVDVDGGRFRPCAEGNDFT